VRHTTTTNHSLFAAEPEATVANVALYWPPAIFGPELSKSGAGILPAACGGGGRRDAYPTFTDFTAGNAGLQSLPSLS